MSNLLNYLKGDNIKITTDPDNNINFDPNLYTVGIGSKRLIVESFLHSS